MCQFARKGIFLLNILTLCGRTSGVQVVFVFFLNCENKEIGEMDTFSSSC